MLYRVPGTADQGLSGFFRAGGVPQDRAVNAAVARMLHRNAGRLRICQRKAGIVEALIGEMRELPS